MTDRPRRDLSQLTTSPSTSKTSSTILAAEIILTLKIKRQERILTITTIKLIKSKIVSNSMKRK